MVFHTTLSPVKMLNVPFDVYLNWYCPVYSGCKIDCDKLSGYTVGGDK